MAGTGISSVSAKGRRLSSDVSPSLPFQHQPEGDWVPLVAICLVSVSMKIESVLGEEQQHVLGFLDVRFWGPEADLALRTGARGAWARLAGWIIQ